MKKIILLFILLVTALANAQDYNSFLTDAQNALASQNFRKAYDNATKAIELSPTNSEARWLRINSSLTANAPKERLITAIDDLELISQTEKTGKVYKTLGLAESELATYIYNFNQSENAYLHQAKVHYENAKKAYQKAIAISPDLAVKLGYEIKAIDNKLLEIKSSNE